MSIHCDILSRYLSLPFSIRALNPSGLSVLDRIYLIPSSRPWFRSGLSNPWTTVSETGWMIAMPPPSAAAAPSSGLEHGYIAPQIIGNSTPACWVSLFPTIEPISRRKG